MTISNETCTVTVTGNGATTVFNYSFLIPYQSDGTTPAVEVILIDNSTTPPTETTLVEGTDYTISGVDNEAGGTVTYDPGAPIPSTEQLKISRALDYTQPDVYNNQGFYPANIEDTADKLVMLIQQLSARITALGG